FPNLSIEPAIRSFLVSSRLAVTIHSMYSFLLVNESVSKYSASFLFFLIAPAKSGGRFTFFETGSTHLKTSLSCCGFASFFLSCSVLARKPNTDQVSSKEIRLIQVSLSPSAKQQSQPLSRLRSV